MITLPDKIRNDLSSSAYQLQYLLEIQTTPPILIGTRKENLKVLQGYDDFVETLYGEELIPDPFWEQQWWISTQATPEEGTVILYSTVCYTRIPGGIEAGKTYQVDFEISGSNNELYNIVESHAQFGADIINTEFIPNDGVFSFDFTPSTTEGVANIYFLNCAYATLHSLSIKEKTFVGGTSPIYSYTYYEDANMKVSNLKEKIDLKTKKIQYSDFTFTLSNLEGINGRLSDNLDTIYGADISLYAITQSCDSIMDKLPIARLKATRMDHDDTTVKISANDRNIEGFYVNLPKTLLEKDVNTYEAYNLKPVPILYGHLENAPATVYLEEDDYNPRLIVDDSYFTTNKEI